MATLRDIALRAGVSIGTVDRVIHDRGRVAQSTRDRVRRLLVDSDYRTNVFARNLSLARKHLFGVIMPRPDQDGGYWALATGGIERAAQELSCYSVTVACFHYDRYRTGSFLRARRALLKARPDAVLLAPVLPGPSADLIADLPPSLPYGFFDAGLPGSRPTASVTQDPFRSGLLAAKLFDLIVRDPGTVALIRVYPDDRNIQERSRGFASRMETTGRLRCAVHDLNDAPGQKGLDRLLQGILDRCSDLRGIFVTNSWTHAAADFLVRRAPKPRIPLIGYDAVGPSIPFLRSGIIDFLISQRPEIQGYRALHSIYRRCVLGSGPEQIPMPIDIITDENYFSTDAEWKGVDRGRAIRHRC